MEGETPGNPLNYNYNSKVVRNKSGNARVVSHKLQGTKTGADNSQASRNSSQISRTVSQDDRKNNTSKPTQIYKKQKPAGVGGARQSSDAVPSGQSSTRFMNGNMNPTFTSHRQSLVTNFKDQNYNLASSFANDKNLIYVENMVLADDSIYTGFMKKQQHTNTATPNSETLKSPKTPSSSS